jgi:outer membrane protein
MVKKNVLLVGCCIVIAGLLVFAFIKCKNEKTAYVNISKVYQEFELKKELEAKMLKVKNVRTAQIDSLELNLKVLSRQINAEKGKDKTRIALFNVQREAYQAKKQQFEEDNQAMIKEYDQQIYKQMTQYVLDFGKDRGYKYIFGADGSGNLMYADESNDITIEVSAFINKRYKGITN